MCSESDSSISTSLATERETLTGPCMLVWHASVAAARCSPTWRQVWRQCGMHEDKRAGSRKHAGSHALGAQRGEEVVRRVTAWGVRDP
jgi:hypothetical protein